MSGGYEIDDPLRSEAVILRPLRADDLPSLTTALADPGVWAGTDAEAYGTPEGFADLFDWVVAAKGGLCVEEVATGRAIGLTRVYNAEDAPEALAIGWTALARSHWGGDSHWAMSALLLEHLFEVVPEVWFHIGPTHDRAQGAVVKLGAMRQGDRIVNLNGRPSLWRRYVLRGPAWQAARRMRALRATSG